MATTYTLINSNVLSSTAASVTFSAIPATYTDLVVKTSARGTASQLDVGLIYRFNSDTGANYSYTYVQATGSTTQSGNNVSEGYSIGLFAGYIVGATGTADTFNSAEMYIPSYTVSQKKPTGSFTVIERNSATGQYITGNAGLWNNTAAITQIDLLLLTGSFVSGSSFYLYGISNA